MDDVEGLVEEITSIVGDQFILLIPTKDGTQTHVICRDCVPETLDAAANLLQKAAKEKRN